MFSVTFSSLFSARPLAGLGIRILLASNNDSGGILSLSISLRHIGDRFSLEFLQNSAVDL